MLFSLPRHHVLYLVVQLHLYNIPVSSSSSSSYLLLRASLSYVCSFFIAPLRARCPAHWRFFKLIRDAPICAGCIDSTGRPREYLLTSQVLSLVSHNACSCYWLLQHFLFRFSQTKQSPTIFGPACGRWACIRASNARGLPRWPS